MDHDSLPSTFNHMFFNNGQWWSTNGSEAYEGPVEALQQRFQTYAEPTFIHEGREFIVKHERNTTIVRPLGQVGLSTLEP